jgi:hypothetical protein
MLILLNENVTFSSRLEELDSSPASMSSDITRPSSILIVKYSSGVLPDLRTVKTAVLIASFVRSAAISAVDALSTRLMIFSSRIVAFPVAPPPPSDAFPCIPHDQPSTSTSFLCLSSCASPEICPWRAPLTLRNMSPAPAREAAESVSGTPT